ncbi:putative WRKY transcription factor 17 isoform X2 [Carex littledalei]|uniref:Putative WRKY transcription factor 17 isoform X2 n=1 Tax=Carex littledalei TaxID=544730 RepID=A0A833RFH4_9POAL|nr:putative WRKY transcription factor 17 isoform X2 [Carex littledalei]
MDVNPIKSARFRRSPVTSQAPPAETKAAPASSSQTQTQTQTQTQRSDLFGVVCLNCPLDNHKSCDSCSAAVSAASLDQSTARVTKTLEDDEESVYNGRKGGSDLTGFKKPSTTMAMSNMPGAEEETVYNGKIFSGHQWHTDRTAVRNEAIFEESIHRGGRLVSFAIPSPSIHPTDAATEKESTSLMYDKTSHDRPGRSKRSRQEKDIQFVMGTSTSVPEWSMQNGVESEDQTILFSEAGTSGRLPAPTHPSSSSCRKRRKTARRCVRVPAVNSEEPPDDGYRWWKSGKKQIKGSSYPRDYYQCKTKTHSDNCAARKHVMRALNEPAMLDITYYGEHSAMSDTTPFSASASAVTADIVPGNVPAAPLEEPTTANPTRFFNFL